MKKITTLLLCLLMVTSVMVGCTSKTATEDKKENTGDLIMENTFKGTIIKIEVDATTDVTLATIEPNEGEEILSVGNTAIVGLVKDHSYKVGDTVTIAYGKAFSDNGKIEFDNVTIQE